MSEKRILHVGLGGRGRYWLSQVQAHAGVVSAAWVDPSEASLHAAQEAAPNVQVPTFSSVREAAQTVQADIAVIAAAATGRRENCMEAIEAGLHVLVEKPFALTLADAKDIVHAAARAGVQIVVGQNYRYIVSIAEMERQIRDGRLGDLGIGCFFRTRRRFGAGTYQQHMRHNYLWEMSVHDFDLIRFSLGLRPRTITGWSWQPPWGDFSGETSVQVLIEFEQNVRVNYLGAWASWVGEYFWRVDGSGGVLRAANDLQFGDPETGKYSPVPLSEQPNSEWPLMEELLEAIRTGTPARTSGQDNLWTIAMLEATQKATGQDEPVDVAALVEP
ncbi:MAG: Gfo/Idh/MocA family oxidoreductase [candidate division Zixibacteria bacterium]|nr:Gfo/Idh/MocA family oxidoreductase [candidate division Zixibacteria bacterium]